MKRQRTKSLQPPENFATVEPGIYRSALPQTESHFEFLCDSARIKTVVFLSQEVPAKQFKEFTDRNDITLVNLGLHIKQYRHFDIRGGMTLDAVNHPRSQQPQPQREQQQQRPAAMTLIGSMIQYPYSSNRHLREELIKEALQLVLNTNYHPALITCSTGVHLTGTVVACLRRMQYWSLTSILEEYRSFTGTNPWKSQGYRYVNEQFIELFDPDLISLPHKERLPPWFIFQEQMMEEDREEFEKNKSCYARANEIHLSKDDPRYACKIYYFCTNGPLISGKSEGDYTDKSLIEDDES